jgi:hypothetical protein
LSRFSSIVVPFDFFYRFPLNRSHRISRNPFTEFRPDWEYRHQLVNRRPLRLRSALLSFVFQRFLIEMPESLLFSRLTLCARSLLFLTRDRTLDQKSLQEILEKV